MALLEVNGITKVFGGLVAVEKVEFKVNQGEIVSIIGPNGAGKTTIFNMLTGVYKVNDGTIVFDGKEIHNKQPREIVKAGIARTFQNIRLFPTMRVIENVLVGEHINVHYRFWDLLFKTKKYREEEKKAAQRAIDLLESLDLGTLSAEKDTVFVYPVKVAASDLKGTLSISAPETGVLSSGENTLAFSNDFGTQSITEDTALTSLSGQLTVAGEAVASAAAGNYTGTTSFTVTYTAD